MKILIILMMLAAACMLMFYFISAATEEWKFYKLFRICMLILILMIGITWIVSMVFKQPFHILLVMLVMFIILYHYS